MSELPPLPQTPSDLCLRLLAIAQINAELPPAVIVQRLVAELAAYRMRYELSTNKTTSSEPSHETPTGTERPFPLFDGRGYG